jgi:alpha-L-rhamnosidase
VIVKGEVVNGEHYYPGHLTTGLIGTKYLFPALSKVDKSDLAFSVATQTTYPSWGYMVENGATTLWEHWSNQYHPAEDSSHNRIS